MMDMMPGGGGGGDPMMDMMPDLSHLSVEERAIIEQVLQRQKAEEQKEEEISQRADKELDEIERQINDRKENALRLIGTQDDAICQICQKTKFADGIGHKCYKCQLRSCARCGGKTTSKNKNIWACSLCQKRQQILARTGKWFQNPTSNEMDNPNPSESPTPSQSDVNLLAPELLDSGAQKMFEDVEAPSTATIENRFDENSQHLPRHKTSRRESFDQNATKQSPLILSKQIPEQSTSTVSSRVQPTFVEGPSQNGNGNVGSARRTDFYTQNGSISSRVSSLKVSNQTQSQTSTTLAESSKNGTTINSRSALLRNTSGNVSPPESALPTSSTTTTIAAQQRPNENLAGIRTDETSNVELIARQHRKARTKQSIGGVSISQTKTQLGAAVTLLPTQQLPPAVPPTTQFQGNTTTALVLSSYSRGGAPSGSIQKSSRRLKQMSRPIRSLSSSEDEINARKISECVASSSSTLPATNLLQTRSHQPSDPDFSEKDLLRYIYGSQNFVQSNGGKSGKLLQRSNTHDGGRLEGNSSAIHYPEAGRTLNGYRVSSSPRSNNNISAGKMLLATKIWDYLSNPVSWQPSADQRRFIGHMVLTKPASELADFGLKVIGGRHSDTGKLGTFVTKVKLGSVADTVGQLRPGDEVLEWNSYPLQNLPYSAVYDLINGSRNDAKLELIVSRCAQLPDSDDFLNLRNSNHVLTAPASYDSQTVYDPHALIDSLMTSIGGPVGFPTSTSLNQQQYVSAVYGENVASTQLPHSQSLINSNFSKIQADYAQKLRTASPLIFHHSQIPNNYVESAIASQMPNPNNIVSLNGHICGRVEISLLYVPHKRELVVTLHRAYDLSLRQDGSLRNPFIKLFLLPDRSEKSRRQSGAIAETLTPIWNECFYYYDLTEPILNSRVLEVTLWDYDKYETNSFLGETLIDLSQCLLDNQPFFYLLLDMDDENPIRLRLKQRRYSAALSNTPPARSRSQTSHYPPANLTRVDNKEYVEAAYSLQNLPYFNATDSSSHRVRAHRGAFPKNSFALSTDGGRVYCNSLDWNKNSSGVTITGSGYFSDHGHHYVGNPRTQRRPRSATALRNVAELEDGQYYNPDSNEPYYYYEDQRLEPHRHRASPANLVEAQRRSSNRHLAAAEYPSNGQPTTGKKGGARTRQEIIQEQSGVGGGYGSDGSETLSVNSAQSMQNRALRAATQQQQQLNLQQQHQQQQQNLISSNNTAQGVLDLDTDGGGSGSGSLRNTTQHQNTTSTEDFDDPSPSNHLLNNGGAILLSGGGPPAQPPPMMMSKGAAMLLAKRKKSLMTRFIPGRNGPSDVNKRMGFARSEEVGVLEALSVALPAPSLTTTTTNNNNNSGDAILAPVNQPDQQANHTVFKKQISKESTDSSDNWLPVVSEKPLGNFVENLGPGQVVGRQVLASPIMGEIQIGLSLDPTDGIIVDVMRAKNLVIKPGAKVNPAPYVKAYLMAGKNCVAKAKTQPVRRTTAPLIQQRMAFNENPNNKMLQLSVLGDYTRLERKSFMGIAQINLNELNLSVGGEQLLGWYKLFHSSSLTGGNSTPGTSTAGQPCRKDSEQSLSEQH